MKENLKNYQLVSEHPDHFMIHDAKDKKHFPIAKKALNLAMHAKLAKLPKFYDGGKKQDDSAPADDNSQNASPVTVNVGAPAPQAAPVETSNIPAQPMPMQAANMALPAVPTTPAQPVPATVPVVPRVNLKAPLTTQAAANEALIEKGITGTQTAAAQESAANAQAIQAHNDQMAALMKGYNDTKMKIANENQALTQAVMDGKIDPNHYWNNLSIPGKIASALSVIVSGYGAGLSHSNVNGAMEVINRQISNDIDAQKANLGKKTTLLSMNLQKYRDLDTATQATQAQMQAMLEGSLKLSAAKSANANAQNNTNFAIGKSRNEQLAQYPDLAMKDFNLQTMHQAQGTQAPPSAAGKLLDSVGRNPNAAPTPIKTMEPLQKSAMIRLPDGSIVPGNANGPTGMPTFANSTPNVPAANGSISPDAIDMGMLQRLKVAKLIDPEDAKSIDSEIAQMKIAEKSKNVVDKNLSDLWNAVDKGGIGVGSTGLGEAASVGQGILEGAPFGLGKMFENMPAWGGTTGRAIRPAVTGIDSAVSQAYGKRMSDIVLSQARKSYNITSDPTERQADRQRLHDIIDNSKVNPDVPAVLPRVITMFPGLIKKQR